jgi:hypothetical protein
VATSRRERFGWTLERCQRFRRGSSRHGDGPSGPAPAVDQVAKGQGRKVLFGGGWRSPKGWVLSSKGRAARSCSEMSAFAPNSGCRGRRSACGNPAWC